MKILDVLGYYFTRFSQIEIGIIEAIMGREIECEKTYIDTTDKNDKLLLKRTLQNSGLFEPDDLKSLLKTK